VCGECKDPCTVVSQNLLVVKICAARIGQCLFFDIFTHTKTGNYFQILSAGSSFDHTATSAPPKAAAAEPAAILRDLHFL
jgi:hypothetical protein